MTKTTSLFRLTAALFVAIATASITTAGEAHLLRAGDVLEVKVFEHSELDLSVRVQKDGTIRMPMCGKIKAANLSAGDLADTLSESLKKARIEEAFVTVFVTEFAPRPVYVLGEVKDGGKELQIPAQGRLSVIQAISAAGGFTAMANKTEIGVLRLQADGSQKLVLFDATAVRKGVKDAADLALQPGDSVMVAATEPVSAFGMVKKPGRFALDTSKTTTCSALICLAGGLAADADGAKVLVMKAGPDGTPTTTVVDMDAVLGGDLKKDVILTPGDVVVVNAKDQAFVLGEVKKAGAISLDRKVPLTVTKALAQVGGTTRSANRTSILLFRGDKASEVNLKSILMKDRQVEDPVLQPGDVLFVPESMW